MTRREAFWAPLASLFGGKPKDGPPALDGKRLAVSNHVQVVDGDRVGDIVVVWRDQERTT